MHRERGVGDQGPRRCGPDDDPPAAGGRCAAVWRYEIEGEIDRRILDVLVALGHLVRRERGAAARTIGEDLVALIQQSPVVERLERPPLALDVLVRVRDVGIPVVEPVRDALDEPFPLFAIRPDALAAATVERLDADPFDVLLATEAQRLLHLDFHWQPVRIPSGLARHVVAEHRAVTAEEVLHRAGEHVVDTRASVGRWRAVVKHELGCAGPAGERARHELLVAPEREQLPLQIVGRPFRRQEPVVHGANGGRHSRSRTPRTSAVSCGSARRATPRI